MTEEIREKIIDNAIGLFFQYGVRSVTMDDVAREASMSKKTLYQYFDNKDDLVTATAEKHIAIEHEEFEKMAHESIDAIDEIINVSKCLRQHVFKTNPALLFDLQKYHASAWNKYLDFKNSVIRGHIKRNIEKGIKEGCFRKEIDPDVISTLRVEQVQLVFNPKIFPRDKFDFREVQIQILDHFVHGLLTDQGRNKYLEYSNKELSNH